MGAIFRLFKNILLIIISVLLVALAAANNTYVSLVVPLTGLSFQLPIYLIILISLIIGILLGGAVMASIYIRRRMENRAKEKRIRLLEDELESVKAKNSNGLSG